MKNKKILIEFHGWKPNHYLDKILLKALKKKFNSSIDIEAYSTDQFFFTKNIIQKIIDKAKIFFGKVLSIKTFGFYKSELGVKNIFSPNIFKKHEIKSLKFCDKFFKKKLSKKKILNLKVNGIYIGDIIYDSYIRSFNKATIDDFDENFRSFLNNFLSLFYFWEEYFKVNQIKAVISHHNTYLSALPARIASYKNIKCLIDQDFKLYQLNKKNFKAGLQFRNYKNNFKKFSKSFQKKAIKKSNLELIKKFNGDTTHEYYMLKSPFSKSKIKKRAIKKNNKFKILILPLSFYDSPSGYGGNLFNDFYEWLTFVLKLSLKTNYDWYIKLHPDVLLKWDYLNYEIVLRLLKKYKNVKWIPPEVSHNQIIKEGINAALTIHGTVGSEYPYFKIPVVNACKNNPHMNYNFNFHPQNKKELKRIILKLPNIKKNIKKNEISEFFFMHHILPSYNWLGINMKEIVKKKKIKHFFSSDVSYYLISEKVNEPEVLKQLEKFLNTDNYIFEKNYDKNTSYENLFR